MQFNIGDKVVYPSHGLGVIKRVETRRIGDVDQYFYLVQCTSGATLMVPFNGIERAGMRPVMSRVDLNSVLDVLKAPPKFVHTTWNRRFREFNDKLRSGSLFDAAEVLRDTNKLAKDKDLSYGEKKMFDKAFSLIRDELTEAMGFDPTYIENLINEALERK